MVSRAATGPSGLIQQLGPNGAWIALAAGLAGTVLAGAVAVLPFEVSIPLALALPVVVAVFVQPRVAILLLAISIPFQSYTRVPLGKFETNATDVLVALIVLGWVSRGIVRRNLVLIGSPMLAGAFVWLAAAWLSSLGAEDFPAALKELLKLGELIAMLLFASSTVRREGQARFAVYALLAAGALESVVGLFQFFTGRGPEFFAIGPFMRAYGDFSQPNALAGYLSMLLPLGIVMSFRPGRAQPFVAIATCLIASAVLATLSRGAWLGILTGLALMAVVWDARTRRLLALGIALIAILSALAVTNLLPATATERITVLFENFVIFDVREVEVTRSNWPLVERMAHWQAGWAMAMDHPTVGVGPGNYEAAYERYYLMDWREALGHAHNFYLNTFAELGIIGLVAFLGFLASVFVRLGRGIRSQRRGSLDRALLVATLGAFTILCVHNTFDNMLIHGIGVQLGLILGIAEASVRGLESTSEIRVGS